MFIKAFIAPLAPAIPLELKANAVLFLPNFIVLRLLLQIIPDLCVKIVRFISKCFRKRVGPCHTILIFQKRPQISFNPEVVLIKPLITRIVWEFVFRVRQWLRRFFPQIISLSHMFFLFPFSFLVYSFNDVSTLLINHKLFFIFTYLISFFRRPDLKLCGIRQNSLILVLGSLNEGVVLNIILRLLFGEILVDLS